MEENTNVTTQAPAEVAAQPKEGKKFVKRIPRKKVCAFCQSKADVIDYKDINTLKKYITEGGKFSLHQFKFLRRIGASITLANPFLFFLGGCSLRGSASFFVCYFFIYHEYIYVEG